LGVEHLLNDGGLTALLTLVKLRIPNLYYKAVRLKVLRSLVERETALING